jgi:hypothetical protein
VQLHFADSILVETRRIIASIAKTCRIHRTLSSAPEIKVEVE